jgi:hypothetical protein
MGRTVEGIARRRHLDRTRHLKKRYGLGIDDYIELHKSQGGVCAICGEVSRVRETLVVDHDHKSGVVRGLLCYRCNLVIGMMGDANDLFVKASEYLRRYGSF